MSADTFQLVLALLGLALTAIGALLIYVLAGMASSVKDLDVSVKELNVKMGVICERVDAHEHRLTRLEAAPA